MYMNTSKKDHVVFQIDTMSVVRVILVIFLFAAAYVLRDLLLILLAAVVIASAIEPMVKWFRQYRVARLPAVMAIYLSLAVLIVAATSFLLIPLLNETSSLLNRLPEYVSSVNLWEPLGNDSIIGSQQFIQNLSANFSVQDIVTQVQSFTNNISAGIFSTISLLFGSLISFLLIAVISFYLAVQEDGIHNFLKTITPNDHREYVLDLWKRSQKKIGLWFQGQLLLVVIIAVLTYLGLALIGVEYALALAVLAGLFELIPLFGPILAAIPAIALAFLADGPTTALIVLAFYIVIQQFENQLIYPLVVKKVVGVPAIIVIVALIAGGTLAGFFGMLLSVPIAAILMELFTDMQKGVFARK